MSEEQIADSLRDDMRIPESQYDETESRQELHVDTGQPSEYSPEMLEDSVNGARKPRKRNFSQRTKTGCQ